MESPSSPPASPPFDPASHHSYQWQPISLAISVLVLLVCGVLACSDWRAVGKKGACRVDTLGKTEEAIESVPASAHCEIAPRRFSVPFLNLR